MIKTIIIEDEPNALESLKIGIQQYIPALKIIGEATTIEEGKQVIEQLCPELVLLDIRLGTKDAFQLLDSLDNLDFEIIFTTAYGEFKETAFDYFALHYLMKPIDFEKLKSVVSSYEQRKAKRFTLQKYAFLKQFFSSGFKTLSIPSSKGYNLINIDNIMWCEASGNYTIIFMEKERQLIASKQLKYYENILREVGFFRIHRSLLVNIKQIYEIKENTVILKNKKVLTVSRRNKKNIEMLMRIIG
ncbi:response regulator transcription factor [Tenacibaculum aiptasiae]|uniref:Response regulator transcription factor n=1 Tax=Tenacibaculum aiptasiae TaxID=426481 RepID=A0A7J5AMV2_9FLAO|nr:LytTR family DNA-binding domain-containing protein [Tenacibaculum aiptasiae]KAB1158903.1 response regulator transcription factor [Tenacibaculum aiptasiae]